MTVRWGILGCGDIARKRVAQAIHDDPGSELVAVCRRDSAKLKAFCEDFGIDRSYRSEAKLIEDDEIDAVYIATPVYLHHPQTLAAAAAGKHVLVEKPMAMSATECDEMVAACLGAGVKLGVAYYRRFYPLVLRIEQLLTEERIGRVMAVRAMTSTPFEIAPGEDGYFRAILSEGGGGALMDIGSHRLNLMLHLFGRATDVKACCTTVAAEYEAEDTATLSMRFSSGVHGSLQCFFGQRPTLDSFEVIGTQGRIICDPLNGDQLRIETPEETIAENHERNENSHLPLIADFVAAIKEDRPPRVTGEEGRAANAVMQMAYEDSLW